jgi:hypothetical protein
MRCVPIWGRDRLWWSEMPHLMERRCASPHSALHLRCATPCLQKNSGTVGRSDVLKASLHAPVCRRQSAPNLQRARCDRSTLLPRCGRSLQITHLRDPSVLHGPRRVAQTARGKSLPLTPRCLTRSVPRLLLQSAWPIQMMRMNLALSPDQHWRRTCDHGPLRPRSLCLNRPSRSCKVCRWLRTSLPRRLACVGVHARRWRA